MFRVVMSVMLAVIAGLAVASAVILTAVAHDKPLHRAYACQFARDFRHEVRLPPAPCHARPAPMPAVAVCAFDGGGLAVAGSVTTTDDSRAWLCTDDGALVPWHGPASVSIPGVTVPIPAGVRAP